MRFVNPIFLILTAIVPVAGLWWAFLRARREKALQKITLSVPKSSVSGLQMGLVIAGLALALFAAARPQWGRVTEKTVERSRNVVVAIDVSRSMLAQDVRPNRLAVRFTSGSPRRGRLSPARSGAPSHLAFF